MRARRNQHEPCRARRPEKYAHEQDTRRAEAVVHDVEAFRAMMRLVTLEEDAPEHASPKRDG